MCIIFKKYYPVNLFRIIKKYHLCLHILTLSRPMDSMGGQGDNRLNVTSLNWQSLQANNKIVISSLNEA